MEKIEISTVKPGIRFSKPVFFDDGKNMFIESGITVKPYHMAALTKWHIPFLLSDGHIMEPDEELEEEIEECPEVLEDLDDIEPAEELESSDLLDEIDGIEVIEEL